jgi:hypothetical protein
VSKQDYDRPTAPDSDEDRLGAAWDEIIAGRDPLTRGDEALTVTVRSLHAGAPVAHPDPTFRHQLKEHVMDAAVPAALPGTPRPARTQPSSVLNPVAPLPLAGRRPVRWLAIAATIALVLATGLAAWFGGLIPSDDGPKRTNIAAPAAATPDLGTPVADACSELLPYIPCGNTSELIGTGTIVRANVSDDPLAASRVQMQGWEIDGSGVVNFAAPANPISGVAIDSVVFGAYQATFSVPVVVTRLYPGGGWAYEYPEANMMIELGSGDSVSYQVGTKTEVRNPFAAKTLKFKSVLFYEGDPSPENLQPDGEYRVRVDGDATLPKALSEYDTYGTGEINVWITYSTVLPGYPFPPEWDQLSTGRIDYVLGPVASTLVLGSPEEGFVVWLVQSMG